MRFLSLAAALSFLSLVLLSPCRAQADTFLGEDTDTKANSKGPGNDEGNPSPARKKKKKKAKQAAPKSDDEGADSFQEAAPDASSDDRGSPLVFSGGVGSGAGFINGQITIGYYFNKYIGIDTSYYYYRFDSHDNSGQQYGPEVDLVVRAVNPTMVTPYVGIGPGYTKWQRTAAGQSFDARSSWTANEFVGVDVRLTAHFGIGITRKQQTYLSDPPKSFDDHKALEAKATWATNIGFRMAF